MSVAMNGTSQALEFLSTRHLSQQRQTDPIGSAFARRGTETSGIDPGWRPSLADKVEKLGLNDRLRESWNSLEEPTYDYSTTPDENGMYVAEAEAGDGQNVVVIAGTPEDVAEAQRRLEDGESLDSILADAASDPDFDIAVAQAQDGSGATAVTDGTADAVAQAEDGSDSTAIATGDSYSTSRASGDSDSVAVAENRSAASSAASDHSKSEAGANGNSTATATATGTSEASSVAFNGSMATSNSQNHSYAASSADQNSAADSRASGWSRAQADA
ncbi:MAG: hypothetical protein AB1758_24490, partial [Candidatus Eremiobacterota bacterium]